MSPELIQSIVVGVLGLIFLALKHYFESKKVLIDEIERDVMAAVDKVYFEYTAPLKTASEDGRLTEEQKSEARKRAVAALLEIGKERGFSYAKKYALPVLESLVQTYVLKRKG